MNANHSPAWPPQKNYRLDLLWGLAVVVVIVGSLLPGQSSTMQALSRLHLNDKTEHFMAYAVLALLPSLHRRRAQLGAILVFTLLLGIGLEFAQLYSPGRAFEVADMVADAAGMCCGFLIGLLFRSALVRDQTVVTSDPAGF